MSSSIVSPFPFFTDTTGAPLEGGYIYIGQSNLNPETAPVNVFWDAALTIPAAQPVRTVGGYPSRQGTPSRFYSATDTYSITVRNKNRALVFSAFDQSDAPTSVFDISTQLITATASQTTFSLTTFAYLPGTDTLQVFRNGLRLNLGLDYLETNSSTVTLTAPAAAGDQFLFQGGTVVTGNQVPGSQVSFLQAGTGAITRNMQDKARESVSVLDFGADSTGATDSTDAFNAAIATGVSVYVPAGTYKTDGVVTTARRLITAGATFTGTNPIDPVPAFGDVALKVFGTNYHNSIVGIVSNELTPNTLGFPTGVTGYGRNQNAGNAVFGIYAEARQYASSGVVTSEIDSFNHSVAPSTNLPPNRAIGTTQNVPVALTIGAGGTANSSIGIQIGSEGSSPQKFLTGIYFNPAEIVDYGIFIDANSSSTNVGLVVKHPTGKEAIRVKTEGTPNVANAVFIYSDGTGADKFSIRQDGKLVFTTGITSSTRGVAGAAQALPSNPTGYLQVEISGFTKLIPYYEP
jgi:hypothetical protein